jgi:oligopeptidase B
MRAMKKGNNLLLLQTNMDYGHGGASGRFDYLKEIALMEGFFLKLERENK